MIQLERLALKHDKWVALVIRSLGCNPSRAEDVVQDSYIRIHRYLQEGKDISYGDDDVNDFYFYNVLRSVYINSSKKKTVSNNYVDLPEDKLNYLLNSIVSEESDKEEQEGYKRLMHKVSAELNSWDSYSKAVFIAYFATDMSLDKLSGATDIGRSSLYNTIRTYRDIMQDSLSEDAEDYNNGDYNLI